MSATFFSGWVAINAFNPSSTPEVVRETNIPVDLSLFSSTTTLINWDQTNIPPQLVNTTPTSVANIVGFDVAYDTRILINGQVRRDCSSTPFTMITLNDTNNITTTIRVNSNTADTGSSGTTFWTNGNPSLLIPGIPITQDQWNQILNGSARVTLDTFRIPQSAIFFISTDVCAAYNAYNYTLTFLLRIYVTTNCQGNNLLSPVCTQFCTVNQDVCFSRYLNFCLNPQTPIIGVTSQCRDFFADYLTTHRSKNLDIGLVNYCKKYKGFADLFNADSTVGTPEQRAIDLDICACHLSSSTEPDPDATVLYRNFQASLAQQVPYFNNVGFISQCLVPQCASSSFKPTAIPPTGCNLPQCLNILSFNNNGTINGNVIIDQNSECASISNNNGPTHYTWTYILVVVIVVFIVILFLLYIFRVVRSPSDRPTRINNIQPNTIRNIPIVT